MTILNEFEKMAEIDKEEMAKKIADLPEQVQDAWTQSQKVIIPSYYLKVNKVVILGMGGSGISGALVQSLFHQENEIPIFVHADYGIPALVDEKTLVIAVSYSGGTEEVLDAFVAAYSRGAKLAAITTGGKLESLARKYKAPYYKFDYPSQPRVAVGYTFGAILGLLKKIGLGSDIYQKDIDETVSLLKKYSDLWKPDIPLRKNLAKKIAEGISGYEVVIWANGLLENVARRWKCQINENAKNSAYFEVIPELSHNTICGFEFPEAKNQYILILKSKLYHPRVSKRIEILKDILDDKQIPNLVVNLDLGAKPLSEMLIYLLLGDYVSYYLAMLHQIDPTPIDPITYFKEQLDK